MVGISANGKRQSRTEFPNTEISLQFAQPYEIDWFAHVNGKQPLCQHFREKSPFVKKIQVWEELFSAPVTFKDSVLCK